MTNPPSPTILVIDDDDVVRDSLRVLLETRGYTVVDFPSGHSFLAGRKVNGAGCVLLDVHMAEMSGLEVLRSLRAAGDNIPVILITGRTDAMVQAKADAYGVVAVLDKPVALPLLFTAIGQALLARPS